MNRDDLEREVEALDAEVQKQEQEEQGPEMEHWRQAGEKMRQAQAGWTIELVKKDGKSEVRNYRGEVG